jgi:DNA topoisomerase-1
VRKGGGFVYLQSNQSVIRDGATLKRIKSLAIPPAWTDVLICFRANGHLQAIGRDARRRKQYLYHPGWRKIRDRQKYAHLLDFARALPLIRKRVQQDLRPRKLTKSKALAAVVRLLELSHIRVGNEEYSRNNHSFGLTTLRNQHVRVRGAKLRFHFRGKSGKKHCVELSDARLARVVARCQEIPGQELFQYIDEGGRRHRISSGDVNSYLREIGGGDFTAKDFRTWAGTVLTVEALRTGRRPHSQAQIKKNLNQAIEAVAARLGNTPAICRKSYIHPAVIDAYLSGVNLEAAKKKPQSRELAASGKLRADEAAVLQLLQRQSVPRNSSLEHKLASSLRVRSAKPIRSKS